MAIESGPGYAKRPEHRIVIEPANARVQVTKGGVLIADTLHALRMDEAGYSPVYYIPRSDVEMARLSRTSHQTYCPFKGTANYYSISPDTENSAWSYEAPYEEVCTIGGYLAFYADRVDAINVTTPRSGDAAAEL